jgi:hypothetical protein
LDRLINGGFGPHINQKGKNMQQNFEDMQPHGLFATPESKEAMHQYLAQFSGTEALIAQTCAMMMYNYIVTNYNLVKK